MKPWFPDAKVFSHLSALGALNRSWSQGWDGDAVAFYESGSRWAINIYQLSSRPGLLLGLLPTASTAQDLTWETVLEGEEGLRAASKIKLI